MLTQVHTELLRSLEIIRAVGQKNIRWLACIPRGKRVMSLRSG